MDIVLDSAVEVRNPQVQASYNSCSQILNSNSPLLYVPPGVPPLFKTMSGIQMLQTQNFLQCLQHIEIIHLVQNPHNFLLFSKLYSLFGASWNRVLERGGCFSGTVGIFPDTLFSFAINPVRADMWSGFRYRGSESNIRFCPCNKWVYTKREYSFILYPIHVSSSTENSIPIGIQYQENLFQSYGLQK